MGPAQAPRSPIPDWVSGYRGLWGLYARDPFEGEDAPAGPMYNRDKTVARAWYDPVGWAGLDKVPPPTETLEAVLEQREDIVARCEALRTEIEEKSRRAQEARGRGSPRCAAGPTSTRPAGRGRTASPSSPRSSTASGPGSPRTRPSRSRSWSTPAG